MSDKVTTWELRLKDLVMGPMKKLMDLTGGTQKKIQDLQGGMDKMARASGNQTKEFQRNYRQLDDLLRGLQRRQAEAFNTRDIQAYQRMIERTRAEMQRLNNASQPQRSRWQRFTGGVSDAVNQIPGASSLISLATNPATLITGASIALGTAVTKLGMDYETGMAKINGTAQLPEKTLDKLKDRLVEIGSKSGGNFELMPEAYEKILSQTNKVNMSLDILETSVKGAKASFTEIDTVASAVAQTLSVVGEGNTTANEVMDTLLKAKAVGAGEFKDFAQYLPPLIAAGNSLHVGFKDVAGLFSYMTAKGQSAADSAMLLQNAFTALQKKEVIKGLEGKGIQLFDTKGMRRNIADVFLDISKKLSGLSDKNKNQFLLDIGLNDAQARSAFSVLTSESEKFKSIMGDVNHALGETDKQLAATANTARTWGDIGDELKAIGVGLGEYLIPVIDSILQGLMEFGRGLKSLFTKDFWEPFYKNVDQFKQVKKQADRNAINNKSMELVNNKFGAYQAGENPNLTRQRNQALVNVQDILQKASANVGSKNKIDPNEKNKKGVPSLLEKVNTGASSSEQSSGLKGSGNGSGLSGNRSLTQNIYINFHIKKESDVDDGKLKRKLTDLITDSARDGLVNVGI